MCSAIFVVIQYLLALASPQQVYKSAKWIDTTWHDHPFMAGIAADSTSTGIHCGASIQSLDGLHGNGIILTAAHCVKELYDSDRIILVWIGCTKSDCSDDGAISYTADQVIIHPDYIMEDGVASNDIALIYLTEPITHPDAQTIDIHVTMNVVANNDEIKTLGYGLGGLEVDALEYQISHFMPTTECDDFWGDKVRGKNDRFCVIDDILSTRCGDKQWGAGLCYDYCRDGYHGLLTVCWPNGGGLNTYLRGAGTLPLPEAERKTTTCLGDSGSPLIFEGKQIGIVSFVPVVRGAVCYPGAGQVAVAVPQFINWVMDEIWKSVLDATIDDYQCTFTVLSVDHISGTNGKYFNFDSSVVTTIINHQWSTLNVFVFNSRTRSLRSVKMWNDVNGGSNGSGHGRVDPFDHAREGDWKKGDILAFENVDQQFC